LLPALGEFCSTTDEDIRLHERAVKCFHDGEWDEALQLFDQLPTTDRSKIVPLVYMSKHDFEPPEDWDGIINLTSK
jgi:hypothetical protein